MDSEKVLFLLGRRPELVTDFPEWLLPADTICELRNSGTTAIAEVAGRDSFAAVMSAVEQHPIEAVLPTIAYTGTQFGGWERPIEECRHLAERLDDRGIRVFAPVLLGAPRFWWALSGRYVSALISRFGFYTPCLGCHVYLHALRVPLARLVGASVTISGARERHDGRLKLNQIGTALDAYVHFMQRFGIALLLPVRYVNEGQDIERMVGRPWQEGKDQPECVLSGNYQDPDGTVVFDEAAVSRLLQDFALPVAEEVVQAYLKGETPSYADILQRKAGCLENKM